LLLVEVVLVVLAKLAVRFMPAKVAADYFQLLQVEEFNMQVVVAVVLNLTA
jgi:hypothetical protein